MSEGRLFPVLWDFAGCWWDTEYCSVSWGLEKWDLQSRTQTFTSSGEVRTKSPVVTDVVGNDYVCGKATSRCSTFSGQGWGLKCASEV